MINVVGAEPPGGRAITPQALSAEGPLESDAKHAYPASVGCGLAFAGMYPREIDSMNFLWTFPGGRSVR